MIDKLREFMPVFGRISGAVLIVLTGLFLVISRILSGVDWSPAAFFRSALETISQSVPGKRADEVRNFVLFSQVPYKKLIVVTGVQYASSSDHRITEQWCYLDKGPAAGVVAQRFTMARINAKGNQTLGPFTAPALSAFNLTETAANKLVKSHCRFQ